MTDPKLTRGLSREHRRLATIRTDRANERFARILMEYGKRFVDGRRLRPGEPLKLARELKESTEAEAPVVFDCYVVGSPQGDRAALRMATLMPTARILRGVEERSYDFYTMIVNIGRRRVECLSAVGIISVFEHAYERYLGREGGQGLEDFRKDFWQDATPLAIPMAAAAGGDPAFPVFLPCGRGLLAGYCRRLQVVDDLPSLRMVIDRNGAMAYYRNHTFCDVEAGEYMMLDLRTFMAFENLREAHEELYAELRAFLDRHRPSLELARQAVFLGMTEFERAAAPSWRKEMTPIAHELRGILARPSLARLVEAARRADPLQRLDGALPIAS